MTEPITDQLTEAAVRSVPMDDGFTVKPYGGYHAPDYLDLTCVTCAWYGQNVAPQPVYRSDPRPLTGHVTRRTGETPLAELDQAAGAHACPPEVTAAAEAARAARRGATVTVPRSA